MALIGTLEHFNLAHVLQRIETYAKTGLLVVQQGGQWVELYFREGRLMCIGPLRTSATLGERLLQDEVISPLAFQDTLRVIGTGQQSETRIALTLMDLGYVTHEDLRSWASRKAIEVLRVLLTWSTGEVHFEEQVAPPSDRLLVALVVSVLLASISTITPMPQLASSQSAFHPRQEASALPEFDTPGLSTEGSSEPFQPDAIGVKALFQETEAAAPAFSDMVPNFTGPAFAAHELIGSGFAGQDIQSAPSLPPEPVPNPVVPPRIDTSFMRPDMVLVPKDLSGLRQQNPPVQVTPDQWRVLTRVDGSTPLQIACQELAMTPERFCQVAGELIAMNIIQIALPAPMPMSELSPSSREMINSGLGNGYVIANPTVAPTAPWSTPMPSADALPQFSSATPFETQSQWGNGGNNATFVPGRGWIASPQPLQPLNSSDPLASYNDSYAQVGGNR